MNSVIYPYEWFATNKNHPYEKFVVQLTATNNNWLLMSTRWKRKPLRFSIDLWNRFEMTLEKLVAEKVWMRTWSQFNDKSFKIPKFYCFDKSKLLLTIRNTIICLWWWNNGLAAEVIWKQFGLIDAASVNILISSEFYNVTGVSIVNNGILLLLKIINCQIMG